MAGTSWEALGSVEYDRGMLVLLTRGWCISHVRPLLVLFSSCCCSRLSQIVVFMLVEDLLFYWAHRALHLSFIYPYVHKVHHQFRTSIGIASEYAHPVEFLFSNVIPFVAGPTLCRAHYFTIFMWTILRIGETVDGHSGYEFPWSPYRLLPFSGSSTAHDFQSGEHTAKHQRCRSECEGGSAS